MLWLLPGCLAFHRGAMPGEPADATFLELEGARVRYIDRGRGPPVVLIHGYSASLDTWNAVVPVLEKKHRVLALDLKGFGWTDRPPGDYSPRAQAHLVKALMDARGVEQAAIVAHSYGASVALTLALDFPDAVSRLALYSGYVYEDQVPAFFLWSRAGGVGESLFALYYGERLDDRVALAFYDRRYVTEELVDAYEKALSRPGTRAAALAVARGQRYSDLERRYGTIDKPTLLLWGREDRVTPLSYGERLSRELPRAHLVVFPRCGHFPMIEAAAESTAELARFLEEQR